MSLLTDTTLQRIIDRTSSDNILEDKIRLSPFIEESLTPIGYDLRIGYEYSISSRANKFKIKDDEEFKVKPNETAFITTLEKLTMPSNKMYSGLVVSKVSITAKGIINDTTTIDPDWSGNLLLVLHNLSKNEITLKQGQQVSTIVFLENKEPSSKSCNKDNNRNALLIDIWNELNNKAKRKEKVKQFISPAIIITSFFIGNYFFGNTTGLTAFVAIGVALSQFFKK
ncbi:MAG: hypothetical protein NTX22_13310 [Ignavibacteriales bacterium]|nr:hypothetical protein [Ignavibacteriales bacterium]